jgi:ribonuclease P protein component
MIPFSYRFHGHSSLRYVYKNGQAVRSRLVTIKTTINPNRKNSRVAVVISKKVLKSAVGRNRIRRRIYEYIRPKLSQLNNIYDIVIIVSSAEMLNIEHNDMVEQLDQIINQAGLINPQS